MKSQPVARSERRGAVLQAVREEHSPVSVAELASTLHIHPNTVRFHLQGLEQSGEVVRAAASAAHAPGRPAITYQAVPDQSSQHQRSDLLAHILLAEISSEERPLERARSAGERWGRREALRRQSLTEAQHGNENIRPSRSFAIKGLVEMLDTAGFAPQMRSPEALDLLHCPLKEFVAAQGRIACAVHEGMMRGVLEQSGSDVSVRSLEPFVSPGACRTELTRISKKRTEHD